VVWLVGIKAERKDREISTVNGDQQQERETWVALKHVAFADPNKHEDKNGK
jgi:hypothetical protein